MQMYKEYLIQNRSQQHIHKTFFFDVSSSSNTALSFHFAKAHCTLKMFIKRTWSEWFIYFLNLFYKGTVLYKCLFTQKRYRLFFWGQLSISFWSVQQKLFSPEKFNILTDTLSFWICMVVCSNYRPETVFAIHFAPRKSYYYWLEVFENKQILYGFPNVIKVLQKKVLWLNWKTLR